MSPADLHKLLRPIRRRLGSLITRGFLLATEGAGARVRVKAGLRADEIADNLELHEGYGLTSVPLPDGDGVLTLAVGGHGNNRVALAAGGRKYRPRDLKQGEVCLYTDEGDEIRFQRGRQIRVIGGNRVDVQTKLATVECETATVTATTQATLISPLVTLDAPQVVCTGNLKIGGLVQATGSMTSAGQISDAAGSMQGMRNTYNGHAHPGDSGGTSGTPDNPMGGG